jgi:TolB-like protein
MPNLIEELRRRSVIRVAIAYLAASWLLVQVADVAASAFGLPGSAVGILIIVLGTGLVPAIVLAWVFELTPEGLVRDDASGAAAVPRAHKSADRIIMIVLALAVGFFAIDKFVLDPARDARREQLVAEEAASRARIDSYGDKSIAVLPFVNMSSDAEQEYFADGIAEEMLNLLARIRELRVISRSSAFSFKGRDIDIPTIAETLDVAYILEGSVRKSGDSIRITAQLIEARTDTHVWSQTYDRQLDDIFIIQDDVAAHVVEQLRLTLLDEAPRVKPANPQAYALLIQARHIIHLDLAEEYDKAERLLKQALEIDPEYLDAHAELSLLYAARIPDLPAEQQTDQIRLVEKIQADVLAIDPTHPRISSARAWVQITMRDDLAAAASRLEAALAVHPTTSSLLMMSAILAESIGRTDLAIELGEYAAARDPLRFWTQLNLAEYYFAAGRIDDAMRHFDIAASLNPNAGAVRWKTGLARLVSGDPRGAIAEFELEDPASAYKIHGLALAYHDLGREQESAALLEELVRREAEVWPFGLARAWAWIGDKDKAFDYLQRTAETHPTYLYGIADHPLMTKLHDDPRWQPFLVSIGQTPEQLAEFEFDVRVPDAGI